MSNVDEDLISLAMQQGSTFELENEGYDGQNDDDLFIDGSQSQDSKQTFQTQNAPPASTQADEFQDDDEDLEYLTPEELLQQANGEQKQEEISGDSKKNPILAKLLAQRGIPMSGDVIIQDEDGTENQVNLWSLPQDEQMKILFEAEREDDPYDFDAEEVSLINKWREGNVSPEEFIYNIKQEAIKDFLATQAASSVDEYSDEQLFIYDLQSKGYSEDEIQEEIEVLKQNETLFERKAERLRKHYKDAEVESASRTIEQQEEQIRESREKAKATIIDAVRQITDLGPAEIDDDDRRAIANFILSVDSKGQSKASTLLDDPKNLVKAVGFLLNEKQINENYQRQVSQIIAQERKKAYEEGKSEILKKLNKSEQPARTVAKQPASNKRKLTIDDILLSKKYNR